jgi:hypothetical protein
LIADLFPNLARSELPAVIALFRRNDGWTIAAAEEAIAAGERALAYDGSIFGENRELVRRLVDSRLQVLRELMAKHRG